MPKLIQEIRVNPSGRRIEGNDTRAASPRKTRLCIVGVKGSPEVKAGMLGERRRRLDNMHREGLKSSNTDTTQDGLPHTNYFLEIIHRDNGVE